MIDSRLAIANLEDRLTSLEDKLNANTVTLVDAIRTSRRNIQKEMHALRISQNERMDAILSAIIFELQARCSYQELPGDLCTIMERFKPLSTIVLDVHLFAPINRSQKSIGIPGLFTVRDKLESILSFNFGGLSSLL